MLTVDQLLEESRDPRLRRQPQWIQLLVHDLAHRLDLEHRAAEGARTRAEQEVEAARQVATQGPADSDTYMDLPGAHFSSVDDYEQKPLGKGVNIEFRGPGDEPGEGINAKLVPGRGLKIHGLNSLAVVPQDNCTIYIETK